MEETSESKSFSVLSSMDRHCPTRAVMVACTFIYLLDIIVAVISLVCMVRLVVLCCVV